jgi:L-threonylcarbamoyladenylate synthase
MGLALSLHGKADWLLAAEMLKRGELVVFPTDTVYGVGCDPYDTSAIARIYAAKGRSAQKALPLLLAGVEYLDRVAVEVPGAAKELGGAFWPGALTLVVPRRPELPELLSGNATIAVRVPDHDDLRELIKGCGGFIAATSANLSGQPDATNAEAARDYLADWVAVVIDGGPVRGGLPSTVVDCTVSPARVLREGAIPSGDIYSVLGEQRGDPQC